jgi:hypothetical protein
MTRALANGLAADVRIAARTLKQARGFAAVAILTLALGVALSASVLAVANAYLFKSLPYPGATRLYSVRYSAPGQNEPRLNRRWAARSRLPSSMPGAPKWP